MITLKEFNRHLYMRDHICDEGCECNNFMLSAMDQLITLVVEKS